jgi:hypothetical protein
MRNQRGALVTGNEVNTIPAAIASIALALFQAGSAAALVTILHVGEVYGQATALVEVFFLSIAFAYGLLAVLWVWTSIDCMSRASPIILAALALTSADIVAGLLRGALLSSAMSALDVGRDLVIGGLVAAVWVWRPRTAPPPTFPLRERGASAPDQRASPVDLAAGGAAFM